MDLEHLQEIILLYPMEKNKESIADLAHRITHLERQVAIIDELDHENEKLRYAVLDLYQTNKSLITAIYSSPFVENDGAYNCNRCHGVMR